MLWNPVRNMTPSNPSSLPDNSRLPVKYEKINDRNDRNNL